MKALKPKISARSIRSGRSVKSHKTIEETKNVNEIYSLENLLLVACAKYNCPYSVTVKKETKHDDYYKTLKHPETRPKTPKRMSMISQNKPATDLDDAVTSDRTPSLTITSSLHVNNIVVYLIYDSYNTLIEMSICDVQTLPRILLKIIGLLVPYYKNLVKLTVKKCGINMYTIYELGQIIKASKITDICLDGSPVHGADYTMLLETKNLQNLSLCRCNIYDDTCQLIALKLHHEATADNLLLLNLSTNHITDEGVKYIADALRTNRHLRYLNLADNHITDEGAGYLFDVLIEFPLNLEEIINMRRRRMEYFKLRVTLYNRYLAECRNKSFDEFSQFSRKSSAKKRKTSATTIKSKVSIKKERESVDFIKEKAELMTSRVLGPLKDPFYSGSINIINEFTYCIGNMTLAYLNLAYNNLSYISIKKIYKIVLYQSSMKSPGNQGLVKIVLEGNNLPMNCSEMTAVNDLMTRNTWRFSSKVSAERRKK